MNVPVGGKGMSGAIYLTLFLLAHRTSLLYFLTTKSLALRTRDSKWLTCKVEHERNRGKMKRACLDEGWVRML